MTTRWAVLVVAALLAAGCGRSTGTVGPCYLDEVEPALTLTVVTDAVDGRPLSRVRIDVLTIAAVPVRRPDSWCDLPCPVEADGLVELRVAAPGHRPRTVTAEAGWATQEGGCPGRLDDGAVVTTELLPRRR